MRLANIMVVPPSLPVRSVAEFIDYAIDDHPVRLIALDTVHSGSNKGDFCAARIKRLIDMIDAEGTKPIAVFTHHPRYATKPAP